MAERMIDRHQVNAIAALLEKLGRKPDLDLNGYTHERAGDLIVSLRDEAGRQMVRVTGCDIDLTVPRRAWEGHLSDMHAMRHRKGRDGLSACCPGITVSAVCENPEG